MITKKERKLRLVAEREYDEIKQKERERNIRKALKNAGGNLNIEAGKKEINAISN